jgi:hypothetical protein
MVRCLRLLAGLLHVVAAQSAALAADPPLIDRSIGEQPTYQTKSPGYALLSFGEGKADRVWLVWDRNALYVDRNSNGDLTDPTDLIAAQPQRPGWAADGSYTFEVGELSLGERTHKGLTVTVAQLARYEGGSLGQRADVQALLKQDPSAVTFTVSLDAEIPGLPGGGIGGRLSYLAGPVDLDGVLQFGNQPQAAPVIKIGGPHVITFFGERPSMRVGRASDFVLVVGSPGEGPGTLAMLAYEGTIPTAAYPVADISFPTAKPGDAPFREKYEIKERC